MDVLILEGNSLKILPSSEEPMNILFIKENRSFIDELKEYIQSLDARAYFADDPNEMEIILNQTAIDLVIIPLKALSNMDMLKYINDNFKETKVVITVDREEHNSKLENRKALYANYELLQKQLRLFELKKAIGSGLDYSPN
jgi:DNA-binding NtrC family response regulator